MHLVGQNNPLVGQGIISGFGKFFPLGGLGIVEGNSYFFV